MDKQQIKEAFAITIHYKLEKEQDSKYLELAKKVDEARQNMIQYVETHLPEELLK